METLIKIEYENSEMDVADQNEGFEVDPEKKHDDWNMLKIKSEPWNSSDDVTETTFKERADTPDLKVDLLDIVKEEPFSDDLDGMTLELEVTNQDSTSESEDNLPLHIISKQWKADRLKTNSKVSLNRSNVSEIKTCQIDLDGITLELEVTYQDSSLDSEDNLPLKNMSKQWKADRSNVSEIKTPKILKPAREIILSKEEQSRQMLERSKSLNYQNSPFKCDLCYKGFMDTKAFKNHQEEHNDVLHLPKKRKPNNETEMEILKNQAPLKTLEKGERNKAQNQDNLKIHDFKRRNKEVKTSIETIIPNNETNTLNINSDIKNSKTKANSNKQVTAPKREKKLSKNKNQHKDSICSDETQYKCSYCKKCFNQSSNLDRHLRIHTGEKPYKCSYCTKCFSDSSYLASHVRIHTGEKPYKCNYCTKLFSHGYSLTTHVRIHTGEKPYKCSYCTKCFTASNCLARHVRTHTGEKPYKCSCCTKCYTSSRSLAAHVRTHVYRRKTKQM